MAQVFNNIGLIGKPNHEGAASTLAKLLTFLTALGYDVYVESRVADGLVSSEFSSSLVDIGRQCDLAIVVGGDGNMLGAARVLARFDVAVIGVNRGNLGFLTDLNPDNFEHELTIFPFHVADVDFLF